MRTSTKLVKEMCRGEKHKYKCFCCRLKDAIALVLLVLMRSRTSRERTAVHCPGNLRISRNPRIYKELPPQLYPQNFRPHQHTVSLLVENRVGIRLIYVSTSSM